MVKVLVFGCGFPSLCLACADISLNFLSPLIKQQGKSLDTGTGRLT